MLLNWGADVTTLPDDWVKQPSEGIVDQSELDAVLLNWGSGTPVSVSSVPEPAAAGLVFVAAAVAVAMAVFRRKA